MTAPDPRTETTEPPAQDVEGPVDAAGLRAETRGANRSLAGILIALIFFIFATALGIVLLVHHVGVLHANPPS